MKKALAVAAVLGGAIVVLHTSGSWAELEATVTVRPGETHQTMRGWEVTARAWETNKRQNRFDSSWEAYRDELADRMVNELGINRIRIEIKSGIENPIDYWGQFRSGAIGYLEYGKHYYEKINDNDDPFVVNPAGFHFSLLDYQIEQMVLPMRKRLEANGEKLFINLNYVDFGGPLPSTMSHAQAPEEYAELIAATFNHLQQRYQITPDALEITLEPENTNHWGGRQIGEAMVAAAKRLQQAGFAPQMIAPSTTAASNAPRYFDEIVKVPGAASLIKELAYHRYRDLSPNDVLPEIVKRARRYGIATAMLEHVGGDVAELHADLTLADASAWQQYGIAGNLLPQDKDRGGSYYVRDVVSRGGPKLRMADRTRGLAQYFRYVRMGAVRIGATSDSADVQAVAFRNPGGGMVVVANARHGGTIRVLGLPAGTYAARYTTEVETGRELSAVRIADGEPLHGTLPAAGIVTFYPQRAP